MATFGYCDFEGCGQLASADYIHCFLCLKSLCPTHILDPTLDHSCPTFVRMLKLVVAGADKLL